MLQNQPTIFSDRKKTSQSGRNKGLFRTFRPISHGKIVKPNIVNFPLGPSSYRRIIRAASDQDQIISECLQHIAGKRQMSTCRIVNIITDFNKQYLHFFLLNTMPNSSLAKYNQTVFPRLLSLFSQFSDACLRQKKPPLFYLEALPDNMALRYSPKHCSVNNTSVRRPLW